MSSYVLRRAVYRVKRGKIYNNIASDNGPEAKIKKKILQFTNGGVNLLTCRPTCSAVVGVGRSWEHGGELARHWTRFGEAGSRWCDNRVGGQ